MILDGLFGDTHFDFLNFGKSHINIRNLLTAYEFTRVTLIVLSSSALVISTCTACLVTSPRVERIDSAANIEYTFLWYIVSMRTRQMIRGRTLWASYCTGRDISSTRTTIDHNLSLYLAPYIRCFRFARHTVISQHVIFTRGNSLLFSSEWS